MIEPGTYLLIRDNGTETLYKEQPTFELIQERLGFDEIEYLYLGNHQAIMFIYAIGDGRLNKRASQLYREAGAMLPGANYDLQRDVILINEGDYGMMVNAWKDGEEERNRRAVIDAVWHQGLMQSPSGLPN